jgi:uncharacterized protein (TIGR02145 family)
MKKLLLISIPLWALFSCTANDDESALSLVRVSVRLTPEIYWDKVTLRGDAEITGGESVVEKGFILDTIAAAVKEYTAERIICQSDDFIHTVEQLVPEKLYYVSSYVTTGNDTYFSPVSMFYTTKEFGLDIQVNAAADITARSATLNGTLLDDWRAKTIAVGISYRPADLQEDQAEEITMEVSPTASIAKGDAFYVTTGELQPQTEYKARIWAMSTMKTTISEEFAFSTLAVEIPSAVSGTIDGVTPTKALFSNSQRTSNGNDTRTRFGVFVLLEADDAEQPDAKWQKFYVEPNGDGMFSHSFEGLTPTTDYIARAFAENEAGFGLGERVEFTTLEMTPPSLTTLQYRYDDLLKTAANGELNLGSDYLYMRSVDVSTAGSESLSGYGFYWGTTPQEVESRINNLTATDFEIETGVFSAKLDAIARPGQKIYYQAWAANEKGETASEVIASVSMPVGKPQYRKNATDKTKTEFVSPEKILYYYELDPIEVGGGESFIFLDRNLGAVTPCVDINDNLFEEYGKTRYRDGMFDAVGDYYSFGTNTPGLTMDVHSEPSYDMTLGFGAEIEVGSQGDLWLNTPCPEGYSIPTAVQWQKTMDKFGTRDTASQTFKSAIRVSGTSFVRTNATSGENFCAMPNNYNQWSSFLASSTRSQTNSKGQMDYLFIEYEQVKGSQASVFKGISLALGDAGFGNANHSQTGMPVRCMRVESNQ